MLVSLHTLKFDFQFNIQIREIFQIHRVQESSLIKDCYMYKKKFEFTFL